MNDTVAAPSSAGNELATFVGARAGGLQRRYLDKNPSAIATLARLRRAVSREPGSDPLLWAETLEGIPSRFTRDSVPTREERAAHLALCLYAIHQQSKTEPMHRLGAGFGRAIARLARDTGNEDAVMRRFHALATAVAFSEIAHHARGLVTQLRASGVPLDYGQFAHDLVRLQGSRADLVRLDWGRQYHAISDSSGDQPESNSASPASPEGDPS